MKNLLRTSNLRIYLLLAALCVTVLFSSFGNSFTIDERALVHAMGIDVSENGYYKVTMQVFKPSGAGSDTPVDTSQPNVQVIKSEGRTVSEAIENARNQIGKEVFLGHLQVICFSKEVDFSKPEELFQFALKDKNIYLGVQLCISETSAEEIMNAQISRGTTSAEAIGQILETNVKNSVAPECQMIDFLSCIDTPQYVAMPIVAVMQPEQEGSGSEQSSEGQGSQGGQVSQSEPQIVVTSTAMVKEGKVLEDTLTPEEAQGAAWLAGEAKKGSLVIEHRGELVSVKLSKDHIKTELKNRDGRLIYNSDITVVADLTRDIDSAEESAEVMDEVREKMEEMFAAAEQKAFYKNGADIFGVWRYLRHSFPKSYTEYRDRLDEVYAVTDFEVNVKVRVE